MSDPNTPAGIDDDSDLEIPPIDDDELGGEDTVKANDELDGDVQR